MIEIKEKTRSECVWADPELCHPKSLAIGSDDHVDTNYGSLDTPTQPSQIINDFTKDHVQLFNNQFVA